MKLISNNRRSKLEQDEGVALPLLALLSTVLMAALALAFDLGITLFVLTKLDATAQGAALAAMQGYKTSSASTYDQKLTDAVNRANQVIALNNLQWETTDTGNPLGQFVAELDNCTTLSTSMPCDGGDQSLAFGTLYNSDPGTPSDPCSGNYPCFINNDYALGEQPVNAIMAQVQIQPLVALFLQVLGQTGMAPTGNGMAVTIPKHYVAAIDLSASIAWEYHLTSNPLCDITCMIYLTGIAPGLHYDAGGGTRRVKGLRTKFAFNKTTVDGVGGQSCAGYLHTDPDVRWGEEDYYCGLTEVRPNPSGHQSPWDTGFSGVSNPQQIKHYRNDYALVTVTPPSGLEEFYIEQWNATAGAPVIGGGRRIEALSSVLEGADEARKEFENRANPDDLMAIIGFGEEVYDPQGSPVPNVRVHDLTNDFATLATFLTWNSGQPDWDPANNAFTRFMFPRPLANTNLKEALDVSHNLLASHPFADYSANAVILFSDLMGNCVQGGGGLYTCLNNGPTWDSTMNQIDSTTIPDYVGSSIPLHIFHVGAHVAPHYLNWKSDDFPGNCQEIPEMLYYEVQLSHGPCGANYTAACDLPYLNAAAGLAPFPGASYYGTKWANDTNANYFPIRPTDPNPTCGPGMDEPHADASGSCRDCTLDPALYDPNNASTYQLQVYDPSGKTIADQILEGMNQIMGEPYRLAWVPGM